MREAGHSVVELAKERWGVERAQRGAVGVEVLRKLDVNAARGAFPLDKGRCRGMAFA